MRVSSKWIKFCAETQLVQSILKAVKILVLYRVFRKYVVQNVPLTHTRLFFATIQRVGLWEENLRDKRDNNLLVVVVKWEQSSYWTKCLINFIIRTSHCLYNFLHNTKNWNIETVCKQYIDDNWKKWWVMIMSAIYEIFWSKASSRPIINERLKRRGTCKIRFAMHDFTKLNGNYGHSLGLPHIFHSLCTTTAV